MRRFAVIGMTVAIAAGLSARSRRSKPARSSTTPTTSAPAPSTRAAGGSWVKPAAPANFKPVVADTLSVVTSLPGPGFWEGSDTDPTKLTHGYEYDIAKCMQQ